MTSAAASEVYKFVRDRYDKIQSSRVMAQSRVGHLLIMTGILTAGLTNVGVPQLLPAFNVKHTYHSSIWLGVTIFILLFNVYSLGMLVYHLLKALGYYKFAVPDAEKSAIIESIEHKDLNETDVFRQLASLYFDASDENLKDQKNVGKHLNSALGYLKISLATSALFLLLLIFVRILILENEPLKGV